MPYDPARHAEMKLRRRRARRLMMLLTLLCGLVAVGLGAYELHAQGLNQFLFRAPGVGASK